MEKPQSGCQYMVLNNHSIVQAEWLFFYLLKIITNAIIKAIAMTDTPTNAKHGRYIRCNFCVICKAATHSAYSHFL